MTKAPPLRIANDLALPLEFVTKTAAILAQRRKGKTYTASVLAEELVAAGQPWVALDPTGAWWGLRAGADGDPAGGLPVVVLGGQHGDAPLEVGSGKFVAELVVENPGWYVLDLSLLDSRAAERTFATDFAEALIRRKRQPGRDFPLHLFVDEADMFVPQEKEGRGDVRMLGAFQAIVRRGGLHGLGSSLISQRPALVNKSVLTQLDILILLRLVAGQDQDAVNKSYVSRSGSKEQAGELMGSLASLRLGEAWFWEPGAEPPVYQRIQVRERHTFNSSATPKPGERRVEPKGLAEIDLDAVKDGMEAAIERAKADDPKELRARIRSLERDLATAQTETTPETVEVEVEVVREVVPAAAVEAVQTFAEQVEEFLDSIRSGLGALAAQLKGYDQDTETPRRTPERTRKASIEAPNPTNPQVRATPRRDTPVDIDGLGKGEARILTAIAQHPDGCTRQQLTVLTGYKRSSRDTYLQRLRSADLVDQHGDRMVATPAGIETLGDFEPLPTGAELRQYWLDRLPEGERRILEVLVDAWPNGVPRDEISDRTEYKRSSRDTYIQRMKAKEIIRVDGDVYAADHLFESDTAGGR